MNIFEKIMAISIELRVPKEGKNDFKGFGYFKPDDIAKELTPLLQKHDLIAHFDMTFSKEKEMYEGLLKIMETKEEKPGLGGGVVDYHFDIPLTEVQGASKGQNAGATMTYCKRYMLMNAFNIADNANDLDVEPKKGFRPAARPAATAAPKKSQFDTMVEFLQKCKVAQLDEALRKVNESIKYTPEEKVALVKIIEGRKAK